MNNTAIMSPSDGSLSSPFLSLSEPRTAEETGIDVGQLQELCLKTIYYAGRPTAQQIAERTALAFTVVHPLLMELHRQELLNIVGAGGMTEQGYQYTLTTAGVQRAQEALDKNLYVGECPVPFEQYIEIVKSQSITAIETPTSMEGVFPSLVLDADLLAQLGVAMASGKSMFIYGDPGNGKSAIAVDIGAALPGAIFVPYAVEVSGQIIKVFDPRIHIALAAPDDADSLNSLQMNRFKRDMRWVICKRPVVVTGGELTLTDLDLRYSATSKYYSAPLQLKSNNGVLVIDDFGRQLLRPEQLLNRWMIPLDRRVDHLTFHTGETIEVPFDVMLILATNLSPSDLGDEAFFRRIRHKIKVSDPDESAFHEILKREAERCGIAYTKSVADYTIERHYRAHGRAIRGVHGRDLFDLIMDMSKYRRQPPAFTEEWIDMACASYFVED